MYFSFYIVKYGWGGSSILLTVFLLKRLVKKIQESGEGGERKTYVRTYIYVRTAGAAGGVGGEIFLIDLISFVLTIIDLMS